MRQEGERHQIRGRVRRLQRAVVEAHPDRRRRQPRRRAPHVVQQFGNSVGPVQVAVVEPRRPEGRRLERPRPLVVGLVELEGDVGVAGLERAHERHEGVLVVEVIVRRAVHPRLEVELELLDPPLCDLAVDDRRQIGAEARVGDVPHAEAGVVWDLGREVTCRRARPVGVGGVGLAGHVELER